jgi:hypothetical protein
METKYTTDNRKVAIIDKLNNQQFIVQEILISDGEEIPSGENFIVTSLHNSPVVSWREKEMEQWKIMYDYKRDEYEKLNDKLLIKHNLLKAKIEYAAKALKNVSPESFVKVVNFLSGNFTHVVIKHYSVPMLLTWEEFFRASDFNPSKLRLLSLFGEDDGSLCFRLHQYYDGSGNAEIFTPFTNYEDALFKFIESVKTYPISQEIISLSKTYGIELDVQKVSEWRDSKTQNLKKEISSKSILISKLETELEALK